MIDDRVWITAFYIHVISSMAVIITGPLQFFKWFRQRYMNWHRLAGKVYVYAILLLAAPSGLVMAFYAEGGLWSSIGFFIMALLWFFTTLMAIVKIKSRNVREHEIWMMRSYALTFAAVTLRILVPAFSMFLPFSKELIIISTAWLSWLLNLLIAEGMIFAMNQRADKLKMST